MVGMLKEESITGVKKSPLAKRVLRRSPYVYSAICRSRLFYSRSIRGATAKNLYARNRSLFSMSSFEANHCKELADQGYTILRDFLDTTLIDEIHRKADHFFRDCEISTVPIYEGEYATLEGLTYEQLASTQPKIGLKDPMLQIPEFVHIAFHETLLRIVANFLKYVPPAYQGLVVRDFPLHRPKESSYFHKDNDHIDSLNIYICLVDLNDSTGYQVYVPGSHRHDPKSCRPRLTRDIGIEGADGRFTDEEIKRHYPTWAFLKPKRGSVGIFSGNGIHKGPVWGVYGDPRNQPRTTLRMVMTGPSSPQPGKKFGVGFWSKKLRRQEYERLSSLQRLFTAIYDVVD